MPTSTPRRRARRRSARQAVRSSRRVITGAAIGAGAGAVLGAAKLGVRTPVEQAAAAAIGATVMAGSTLIDKMRVERARRDFEHALETSASGYRIAEVIRRHPSVRWNYRHVMEIVPREDHVYVIAAIDAAESARQHAATRNTTRSYALLR